MNSLARPALRKRAAAFRGGRAARETPAVKRCSESCNCFAAEDGFNVSNDCKKGRVSMATRTSSRDVVFKRPFILDGMDAVQPAGIYKVETEEESLDTMLSPAWKRVRTIMGVARSGTTEYIQVSPEQLHEALIRDSAQ
jgi:hypothetical protein